MVPDREESTVEKRRKSTIRDVAVRAGVSISSVSRVLNGHPHVSTELRNRVEAVVRELGYQPHFLGHSLRRGATKTIGFVVGSMANPVMAEMYEATSEVLSAEGYAMILVFSHNEPEQDAFYLRFLAGRQVDGLLVSSASNGPDQAGSLVTELGIPTVMLDRDLPRGHHVSAVQSDHSNGVRAAVSHLHESGHRRIAYVGGPGYARVFRERLSAFQAGMSERNIPVDPNLVRCVPLFVDEGERAAHELLSRDDPPTALLAAGNVLVIGVLRALRARRIAFGQELALVGADDFEFTRLVIPGVTVIGRDMRLFGRTAASLLLEMIRGSEGQMLVTLPTWLIVRESSICGPGNVRPAIHNSS